VPQCREPDAVRRRWISAPANELANIIIGNDGNNTITGGLGNDVLTAAPAATLSCSRAGDGLRHTSPNFQAGSGVHDVVSLTDFRLQLLRRGRGGDDPGGANVPSRPRSFETLVFRNTTIASFTADDFALPSIPPESQAWIPLRRRHQRRRHDLRQFLERALRRTWRADTYVGGQGHDTYLVANNDTTVVEKPARASIRSNLCQLQR